MANKVSRRIDAAEDTHGFISASNVSLTRGKSTFGAYLGKSQDGLLREVEEYLLIKIVMKLKRERCDVGVRMSASLI
jgi:hypothetical protein